MKKSLLIIIVAICFTGCSEYYQAEGRAEHAYYAIDSIECVVEGVYSKVVSPFSRRRGWAAPSKRREVGPSFSRAIVTNDVTYYYKWQGDDGSGPYYWSDTIANTPVNFGDTVRAYGMVRTITNWEGFTFQDIIIDSIEIPIPMYRYVDTLENVVIQGEYKPMSLWLSDLHPCVYLPSSQTDDAYHPEEKYYINPAINFRSASKDHSVVYLCEEMVAKGEWIEVHGDLITGLDTKDEPYWWVNMGSVKIIPIPEQYK